MIGYPQDHHFAAKANDGILAVQIERERCARIVDEHAILTAKAFATAGVLEDSPVAVGMLAVFRELAREIREP